MKRKEKKIGPVVAKSVAAFFRDTDTWIVINKLLKAGVCTERGKDEYLPRK